MGRNLVPSSCDYGQDLISCGLIEDFKGFASQLAVGQRLPGGHLQRDSLPRQSPKAKKTSVERIPARQMFESFAT